MTSTKIAQFVADYEDAGVPLPVAYNVALFFSGEALSSSVRADIISRDQRLTVHYCQRSYHFSLENGDLISYS